MKTARLCKLLITNNRYEYDDMYAKLDLFLMLGRITEDEYVELTGMLVKPEEAEDKNGETVDVDSSER